MRFRLLGTDGFHVKAKNERSLLRARVVVRTSNMKISSRRLADYVKTMHQKACRTRSTIIFLHSTNQIIDLWRCRRRCRHQILNSPMKVSRRRLAEYDTKLHQRESGAITFPHSTRH